MSRIQIIYSRQSGISIEGLDVVSERVANALTDQTSPLLDFLRALEESATENGDLAAALADLGPDHPATLALIYDSEGAVVDKQHLVQHPNLPRFILQRALSGPYAIPALLNPAIGPQELAVALEHQSREVRAMAAAMAGERQLRELELKALADRAPEVRRSLAAMTQDPELIARLRRDRDHRVRSEIALRGLSGEHPLLQRALGERSTAVILGMIETELGDEGSLKALASHPKAPVRERVAERTRSPELVAELLRDQDRRVVIAAAGNPCCLQPQLAAAFQEHDLRSDPELVEKLARRPDLTAEMARVLLGDDLRRGLQRLEQLLEQAAYAGWNLAPELIRQGHLLVPQDPSARFRLPRLLRTAASRQGVILTSPLGL